GSIIGGEGVEQIATGLSNIWELFTLMSYFVLPIVLLVLWMWRRSIVFAIPAILSVILTMPLVAEYGWHYTAPMMALAIGLGLKLLYDAVVSRRLVI
ncbi:MAG: hypothetical protein ACE5IE_05240, partial [Dehalococcoidia bacterium]